MTTSNITTQRKSWPQGNPLSVSRYSTDLNSGKLKRVDNQPEDSIWKSFLAAHPIIKFQRPDFFLIFRYTDSCTILHQENINLDLGGPKVNLENIYKAMVPEDLQHIRDTDKIMVQLIQERKLLPWDYIYKICANVDCPNTSLKRLMRSSILIHRDLHGQANLGLMYFHDVTSLVSLIKPNNYEIACEPELAFLADEIESRLKKSESSKAILTRREKEIIVCIRKGMNSKEIGKALYISTATVNTHRQNMLRKWEVPNTAALLEKCNELDLL